MQHLDDGFLHALADGEVPSDELGPVREHLDGCDACRARLDEARMEAETARELIEFIEVPALVPDGTTEGRTDGRNRPTAQAPNRQVWMRTLAWAATLVLAAGIGYYGRRDAPFAPAAQPVSVGRIDTVFLDVPAAVEPARENDADRNAALDRASRPAELQAAPPAQTEATPLPTLAGARQDEASKRRIGADTTIRLEELVVTGVAAAAHAKATTTEKKEAESKLGANMRQRLADDSRDQSAANPARKPAPQPAAPTAAVAEERLMAKASADAAVVVVTFPRAVELLGGRIKLIEGMVPARLEALGRMVRVIYLIDEGEIVLAQAGAGDSLAWTLLGPLSPDSLGRLRLKVR